MKPKPGFYYLLRVEYPQLWTILSPDGCNRYTMKTSGDYQKQGTLVVVTKKATVRKANLLERAYHALTIEI